MRHMLDEILSIGVDDASVLSILVEDNFFIKKKKVEIVLYFLCLRFNVL